MIRTWIFMHLYVFRDVIILSAEYYREHHILDILRIVSYFVRFFSRMHAFHSNAFHDARWKKDGESEIGRNRRSVID